MNKTAREGGRSSGLVLAELYEKVRAESYPASFPLWCGEKAAIVPANGVRIGFDDYSGPERVMSTFAEELSWLIVQVQAAMREIRNADQDELARRLLSRAERWEKECGGSEKDLLLDVWDEACLALEGADRAQFETLLLALGERVRGMHREDRGTGETSEMASSDVKPRRSPWRAEL
jgi:hypothetical protein